MYDTWLILFKRLTAASELALSSNTTVLLARNAFHLGIGQVVTTALGIASAAVIGRVLEPADFGVLYIVYSISGFVSVIADWGQNTSVVREVARGRVDERELIGGALLIRLASTAFATTLAGTVALGLGYDKQIVMLTLLAMIVGFPNIVGVPFGLTFRAKNRMDVDALAGVVSKAAALAATIVALRFGGGLRELILMQGVGAIASLVVILLFVARHDLKPKYPTQSAVSDILWSGISITAFSLVIASQPFLEAMILSAVAGVAVVGWYGASRTVLGIILSPAMILVGASFPELSRAAQSPVNLRTIIDGTARILFIIAALTASFLYVFSDSLISIIYGHSRFAEAAEILRASSIFVPLLFLVLLLNSIMWAVGLNRAMVVISICRIVFCAIASWFLVGLFQERMGNGAVGLVLIAGAAEIPAVMACFAVLPREIIGKALALNLVRTYVTAICVVVVASLLKPIALWYLVPVFALTFATLAMATRLVLPRDLRNVIDFARSKAFFR